MRDDSGRTDVSVVVALQSWHDSAIETFSSILDDRNVRLDVAVVVDGSTVLDARLAELLSNDPRVAVVATSDGGRASLSDAVAATHGDYVLLVDGEDLVPRGTLAALLGAARAADADLAVGRYVRFHPTRLSTPLDGVSDFDRVSPTTLPEAPGLVRADVVGSMLMRRDLAHRVCHELDSGTAESVAATSALLAAGRISPVARNVHVRRIRAGLGRDLDVEKRVAADIERATRLTESGATDSLVALSVSQIHGHVWDQMKELASRSARDSEQRVRIARALRRLVELVPTPPLGSAEDRKRWEAILQMSNDRWARAAARTTTRRALPVRVVRGGIRRARSALSPLKNLVLPAAALTIGCAAVVACVAGIFGNPTVAWMAGLLGVLAALGATILLHRRTLRLLRSSEARLFGVERELGRSRRVATQLESMLSSLARLEADEAGRAVRALEMHERMNQRLSKIESRTPERTRKLVTRDALAISSLMRRIDVSLDVGGYSDWSATPEMFAYLAATVPALADDTTVIEFGSGLSTLWLSLANAQRERPVRIISLEHDEEWAAETRNLLARHGRTDVELRVAALQRLQVGSWEGPWYDVATIADVSGVSLAIVDGPPSTTSDLARQPALQMLRSKVARSGALVVLDDINRGDEQQIRDAWLEMDGVSVDRALGRAVVLKVTPPQS